MAKKVKKIEKIAVKPAKSAAKKAKVKANGTRQKAKAKASGKAQGTKAKRRRRKRLPISCVRVRQLAIECENMAAAQEAVGIGRPLGEIFAEFSQLARAWDRGRFLRNLGGLASTAATVKEAAEAMGLTDQRLTEILSGDPEAADTWNQSRLSTVIDIKTALVAAAKEGNAAAIKKIEVVLGREIAHKAADFSRLSIEQLVDLLGITRQTLHDWVTNQGCPRNVDKTFNLKIVLPWIIDFEMKKLNRSPCRSSLARTDPFKAAKAEKLEMDLAVQRAQLLDRDEVIAGQLARYQNILNAFNRKAEDLAMVIHGQGPDKITEILNGFFDDVLRSQCKVPEFLRLTDENEKLLLKLLGRLKPEGQLATESTKA